MQKNIFLFICMCWFVASQAQQEGTGRTIDITSSFKPELLAPKKIVPQASPVAPSVAKAPLSYQLPAVQMNFRYSPAPLKPLAYTDTNRLMEDRGYVKAGFGNFSTPYIMGAVTYGNGTRLSGNLEGYFTASKGKLPYQEFARYGLKTHANVQLNERHSLQVRGGYSGQNLNRYGFMPGTLMPAQDSLKIVYNEVHLGATLGNREANAPFGIRYQARLDAHYFGDNNRGGETSLHYDLPLEKVLNDKFTFAIGLKGVLNNLNLKDTSYSNHLAMVRAGIQFKVSDQTKFHAAIIPSWNNGSFALLPMAELESYLSQKGFAVQLGVSGNYLENTWRNLAGINPWISQPATLSHTRNLEIYGAIKGNISGDWSFRLKGHYSLRRDAALFKNDTLDGRSFHVVFEPEMSVSGVLAELAWSRQERFNWTNRLALQTFGMLQENAKAYGLLPVELNSSFRAKWFDKLTTKADLFLFSAPWVQNKGKTERGNGGVDLSLGIEFAVTRKAHLWLQFNNLVNNQYQRWNQYPVLGFQALGGVIFTF